MSGSALSELERLASLPISVTAWEVAICDAPRSWDPAGLFQMLIIAEAGLLRCLRPIIDDKDLTEGLVHAMRGDDRVIRPARPSQLFVDSDGAASALERLLSPLEVRIQVKRDLPLIQHVLAEMDRRPQSLSQGTLTGAGLLQRPLTEAVARLVELEPWRFLPEALPLAISLPGEAEPRFLATREEPTAGLLLYAREDDYLWEHGHQPSAHLEVGLSPARAVPREVRLAFERHHLVVGHGLYPRFSTLRGEVSDAGLAGEPDERALLLALDAAHRFLAEHRWRLPDLTAPLTDAVKVQEHSIPVTARYDLYAATQGHLKSVTLDDLPELPTFALRLSLERVQGSNLGLETDRELLTLVVGGPKNVLREVAPLLGAIESIQILTAPQNDLVIAHGANRPLGFFGLLPPGRTSELVGEVRNGSLPLAIVLLGGPRRKQLDARSLSAVLAVRPAMLRPSEV
ncbi:MAG: hypothetical protein IT384_14145 [Deltaproteobacteria bacterium]|nr:hypothetical protein [Deltaproteobacteria bacterium]